MKNMLDDRKSVDRFSLVWAALLAMFLFFQGVVMAVNVPLGYPPDEFAHISYINDVFSGESLIPDYANGKIINSQRPNYMGHPPLYYATLGGVVKILSLDPIINFKVLRIISAFFVGLGFFYFMLAARHLGVAFFPLTFFALACSATPMFGYLAGSINNDTLMYLGAALFLHGVARSRLEPGKIDRISACSLAAGLTITILNKATAAAFLISFIVVFALISWRNVWKLICDKVFLTSILLVAGICGIYYTYALWTYGTPFPAPGPLYQQSPPTEPLGVAAFALKFLMEMLGRLPIIMTGQNLYIFTENGKIIFYLMILLPLVGWLLARPHATKRGANKFNLIFSDAFIVALIITGLIHLYVVYAGYLQYGLFAGWQPRYYYYALPFIWVPFFVIAPPYILRLVVSAGFALFTMIAFWLSVPFVLAKQAQISASKLEGTIISRGPGDLGGIIPLSFFSRKGAIGAVDELVISEKNLVVRGWAFDSDASTSVRRVWFFENGRYLGSVTPTIDRPDVEKALSNPKAATSGYRLRIEGVPSELRECEVQVAAELSDGSLDMMRSPKCAD